jgi:hypothetical protein
LAKDASEGLASLLDDFITEKESSLLIRQQAEWATELILKE